MSNMAWKAEMPYQNANSTLWTEPLWFSLSVPRWLHFPTKLVSAPLPPPLLLPPPPLPHLHSHFLMFFWERRSVFHQQGQGPSACHSRVRDKSEATLCPLPSWKSLLSCSWAARLLTCCRFIKQNRFCCWNVIPNVSLFYLQNTIVRWLLQHWHDHLCTQVPASRVKQHSHVILQPVDLN